MRFHPPFEGFIPLHPFSLLRPYRKINRLDKNTFATFGATEDRSGYMSKYSFSDSIRDHATLPLNFEPVPVDLRVDRDTMDREFDVLTEGLSDADKAELSKRVNVLAGRVSP